MSINWIEKDFQVYDVINAEEAFLASTPYCVAPVTKINGLPISNGEIGPVFKALIQLWGKESWILRNRFLSPLKQAKEVLTVLPI